MTGLNLEKLNDAIATITKNYPNLNDSFQIYVKAIDKLFAESGAGRINTAKEELQKTTGVMVAEFEAMVKKLIDVLTKAAQSGEAITK